MHCPEQHEHVAENDHPSKCSRMLSILPSASLTPRQFVWPLLSRRRGRGSWWWILRGFHGAEFLAIAAGHPHRLGFRNSRVTLNRGRPCPTSLRRVACRVPPLLRKSYVECLRLTDDSLADPNSLRILEFDCQCCRIRFFLALSPEQRCNLLKFEGHSIHPRLVTSHAPSLWKFRPTFNQYGGAWPSDHLFL